MKNALPGAESREREITYYSEIYYFPHEQKGGNGEFVCSNNALSVPFSSRAKNRRGKIEKIDERNLQSALLYSDST